MCVAARRAPHVAEGVYVTLQDVVQVTRTGTGDMVLQTVYG